MLRAEFLIPYTPEAVGEADHVARGQIRGVLREYHQAQQTDREVSKTDFAPAEDAEGFGGFGGENVVAAPPPE